MGDVQNCGRALTLATCRPGATARDLIGAEICHHRRATWTTACAPKGAKASLSPKAPGGSVF